jgi:hypothetical protein
MEMIRGFLGYAGGDIPSGGEAGTQAETVGGINTGLSVLAVVAVLIAGRFADLGALISWVSALAAGVLHFFAYRMMMTSVRFKRGRDSGVLTFSALLTLIPEIVTIALISWIFSSALFMGLVSQEVEAQAVLRHAELRQAVAAMRHAPSETQDADASRPSPAGSGAQVQRVGLLERYTIAHQLSPAASMAFTSVMLVLALLPVTGWRRFSRG